MKRIVTALFKEAEAAGRAREMLAALGVTPDRIGTHAEERPEVEPASAHSPGTEPGLLRLLDALFLPETDFAAHREALRRGGVVVSVELEDDDAARICEALEEAGAEDLDAEEDHWRRHGWTPASGRCETAAPAPREDTADTQRRARREGGRRRVRSYVIEG